MSRRAGASRDARAVRVVRSSVVRAPREQVWARVVTPDGVADEFGPLLTMRFPPALDGTTRVTDTLRAVPRAPLPGPVVRAVVGALFTHRHRRLARWAGGVGGGGIGGGAGGSG